jgi:hypothetical protein
MKGSCIQSIIARLRPCVTLRLLSCRPLIQGYKMNDQQFIELIRVLDATFGEHDRQGLATGQTGKRLLAALSKFPGTDLSPDLRARIAVCIADQADNVRATLKDVYMFPKRVGEYSPWMHMPWQVPEVAECQFGIKLVDGKVYAEQIGGPAFTTQVYSAFANEMKDLKLEPNAESPHVTLLNSDEVARLGMPRVLQTLEHFCDANFHLRIDGVMTTLSRDWPVFAECAVVKVSCPALEAFVSHFPEIRAKSHHVTFANRRRALKL